MWSRSENGVETRTEATIEIRAPSVCTAILTQIILLWTIVMGLFPNESITTDFLLGSAKPTQTVQKFVALSNSY